MANKQTAALLSSFTHGKDAPAVCKAMLERLGFTAVRHTTCMVEGYDEARAEVRTFRVSSDWVREVDPAIPADERVYSSPPIHSETVKLPFPTPEGPYPLADDVAKVLRAAQAVALFKVATRGDTLKHKKERVRRCAILDYNIVGDAATRGAGQTPHIAKQLAKLRKIVEDNGGF